MNGRSWCAQNLPHWAALDDWFTAANSNSALACPGHYRSVAPHAQSWPRRAPERQVSGDESGPVFGSSRPQADLVASVKDRSFACSTPSFGA